MNPANEQRAGYAEEALVAWRRAKNMNGKDEADTRDLITDLLHLAERDHTAETYSAEDQHRLAWDNFVEERNENEEEES